MSFYRFFLKIYRKALVYVLKFGYESEMDILKYLVILFWTVVYGQVIGFIGSSLISAVYNPMNSLIVSIIFGIILCVLPNVMQPNSKKG